MHLLPQTITINFLICRIIFELISQVYHKKHVLVASCDISCNFLFLCLGTQVPVPLPLTNIHRTRLQVVSQLWQQDKPNVRSTLGSAWGRVWYNRLVTDPQGMNLNWIHSELLMLDMTTFYFSFCFSVLVLKFSGHRYQLVDLLWPECP